MPFNLTDAAEIAAAPYYSLWSGARDADALSRARKVGAPMPTADERTAFAASPKGRLCAAIREIETRDAVAADKLRGLYARSVSLSTEPMSLEVGGAFVAVLNGVAGRAARDSLDCVAEMLMGRPA